MPVVHCITDRSWDELFHQFRESFLVVDVSATWCGPCKAVAPVFEQLASQYPHLQFVKVDMDGCPQFVALYGVRSIPSFLFFEKGKQVEAMTIVGAAVPRLQSRVCEFARKAAESVKPAPQPATSSYDDINVPEWLSKATAHHLHIIVTLLGENKPANERLIALFQGELGDLKNSGVLPINANSANGRVFLQQHPTRASDLPCVYVLSPQLQPVFSIKHPVSAREFMTLWTKMGEDKVPGQVGEAEDKVPGLVEEDKVPGLVEETEETPSERVRLLRERLKRRKEQQAKEDQEKEVASERKRRESGKKKEDSRQIREERQKKARLKQWKEEQKAAKKAEKEIKRRIILDRKERQQTQQVKEQQQQVKERKPLKHTAIRIRFRMLNGDVLDHTFLPTDTLRDAQLWMESERNESGAYYLAMQPPLHVFTEQEMDMPLRDVLDTSAAKIFKSSLYGSPPQGGARFGRNPIRPLQKLIALIVWLLQLPLLLLRSVFSSRPKPRAVHNTHSSSAKSMRELRRQQEKEEEKEKAKDREDWWNGDSTNVRPP